MSSFFHPRFNSSKDFPEQASVCANELEWKLEYSSEGSSPPPAWPGRDSRHLQVVVFFLAPAYQRPLVLVTGFRI